MSLNIHNVQGWPEHRTGISVVTDFATSSARGLPSLR